MFSFLKATSYVSGALSLGALAGVVALPLADGQLPVAEDHGPRAVRIETKPRVRTKPAEPKAPVAKTAPAELVATVAPAPPPEPAVKAEPPQPRPAVTAPNAAAEPASPVPPPAEPEQPAAGPPAPAGWSEAEMRLALEACLTQLAPIAAAIEVLPAPRDGACGAPAAVLVKSLGNPKVELQPAATMNCRMVAALHGWVTNTLQPAAKDAFGQPVTRLVGTSAYVCRTRNGVPGERLSEHAFANAIDIGAFGLGAGRTIDVLGNWGPTERDIAAEKAKAAAAAAAAVATAAEAARKEPEKSEGGIIKSDEPFGPPKPADLERKTPKARDARVERTRMTLGKGETARAEPPGHAPREGAFLRKLHAGACGPFTTVLGPEANEAHRNHFHFDLAERRRGPYCQ